MIAGAKIQVVLLDVNQLDVIDQPIPVHSDG